jgi:hypothetical protein
LLAQLAALSDKISIALGLTQPKKKPKLIGEKKVLTWVFFFFFFFFWEDPWGWFGCRGLGGGGPGVVAVCLIVV